MSAQKNQQAQQEVSLNLVLNALEKHADNIERKFAKKIQRDIRADEIEEIIKCITKLERFLSGEDSQDAQDAIDILSDACNAVLMADQRDNYDKYFEHLRKLPETIKVLVDHIREMKIGE